jgi:hypothetical protein
MADKPALTAAFCERAVVGATPYPSRFVAGTGGTTTLFDLGIVNPTAAGHFVRLVKSRINPWMIDTNLIPSATNTTVQAASDAVMNNAT